MFRGQIKNNIAGRYAEQGQFINKMVLLNNVKTQIIDDQKLYFFDENEWDEIVKYKKIENIKLGEHIIDRIEKIELPIVKEYPELSLTASIGGSRPTFYSRALLHLDVGYQRIYLRKIKCENCDWEGFYGDPNETELYLGIPFDETWTKAIKRIDGIQKTPCPNCGIDFKRKCIWVEKKI